MPHLGERAPSHISIRLWQWLQTHGRQAAANMAANRARAPTRAQVGQDVDRLFKDIGILPGGRVAKLPRLTRGPHPATDRLIQQQRAANEARFRSGEPVHYRDLRSTRPLEPRTTRDRTGTTATPLQQKIIIATGAGTAATIAIIKRLPNRSRSAESRLNTHPGLTQYPNGTRVIWQGKTYVKAWDSWWWTTP